MMQDPLDIHPRFKLNGLHFDRKALKEVAYSLVKEGEDFEIAIGDFLLDWLSAGSGIIAQSSGSTGSPKRMELKKEHMCNSARATGRFFGLEAGNSALHCLPTDFIAGKMMLVRAMILGLELDYVVPSSQPLRSVAGNYDFSAMVPLQVQNSLHEIDRIALLIVGGAPVPAPLKVALEHKHTSAFETYGMTETMTHVAVKPLNPVAATFMGNQSRANPGPHFFTALPGIRLSMDHRDCLVIEAKGMTPQPVITNDVVRLQSETGFEWLGRIDTVINSGGVKIFPEQVERKLAPFIDLPFFIASLPDDALGARVVLVVEGRPDKKGLLGAIEAGATLEPYEIPKDILLADSFVRTGSGKLKRKATLKKIVGQSL